MSDQVQLVFALGLVVVASLAVGLFLVRNFGRRHHPRLPLPHRVVEFYDRFEEGVFSIDRAARAGPRRSLTVADLDDRGDAPATS